MHSARPTPSARHTPRAAHATIQVRVLSSDPRLTPAEISRVLTFSHWLVAEELTGLLTYGGPPVTWKPLGGRDGHRGQGPVTAPLGAGSRLVMPW